MAGRDGIHVVPAFMEVHIENAKAAKSLGRVAHVASLVEGARATGAPSPLLPSSLQFMSFEVAAVPEYWIWNNMYCEKAEASFPLIASSGSDVALT